MPMSPIMLRLTLRLLLSVFRTRQALILENAALRHQIEVLQCNSSRPRLRWRDRDGKFGDEFNRRVSALDIEQVLTSRRSPWQNPYVERVIGSIRRECLDHLIIFGEAAETILQAVAANSPVHTGHRVDAAALDYGKEDVTIKMCSGLREAVRAAVDVVEPGDVVLLSPGGTSFDEFNDFEERGECFVQLVKDLT